MPEPELVRVPEPGQGVELGPQQHVGVTNWDNELGLPGPGLVEDVPVVLVVARK